MDDLQFNSLIAEIKVISSKIKKEVSLTHRALKEKGEAKRQGS